MNKLAVNHDLTFEQNILIILNIYHINFSPDVVVDIILDDINDLVVLRMHREMTLNKKSYKSVQKVWRMSDGNYEKIAKFLSKYNITNTPEATDKVVMQILNSLHNKHTLHYILETHLINQK